MKYLAAYTLLTMSGKKSVSSADLETFFKQISAEFNKETADDLVSKLEGKSLTELLAAGLPKVANLGGASGSGSNNASAPAKKEEKKEEVVVEEEEVDIDMGDLFG